MMNPLLAARSSENLGEKTGSGHSLGDKIEGPQFFSKEMRQPSRTITGLHLAESRTSPEVMADESSAGATEFAAATDTATSTAAVEDDSNDRGFSTSLIVHEEEGTVGGTEAATVAFPAVKEGCNDHRFSVMAQCLNALGLVTKGAEHKLTVFAPTDASFHKLFASIQHVGPVTVDVLRNNRELRRMVKALVVRGSIPSSQLFDKMVLTTVGGTRLQVQRNSKGNVSLAADGTSADAARAQVISFDHACNNGWVHAIDSVPTTTGMSQVRQRAAVVAANAKASVEKTAPPPALPSVATPPLSCKATCEIAASKSTAPSSSSLASAETRRPFRMLNSMDSINSHRSSKGNRTQETGPKKQKRNTKPASWQAQFESRCQNADCCHGCQKQVYVTEKLVVDKTVWHKACFKCTDCKCQLSIRNYACLHGKFYCKPHFQYNFKLKGNYDEGFGMRQRKSDFNVVVN